MDPLLIFRHVTCEGPGYLGEFLERHNVAYRIVAVDQGEPVPAELGDAPGLVFMGGPMSVNDPLPWVQRELALICRAADAGRPVLGHCLGGQLIAKALGGQVGSNGQREIGWLPVERVDGAPARDWLDGLPPAFEVFHWHGETFSLPDGAANILRSEACAHQGFVLDNILALQCHVEMTAPMVSEWSHLYADELDDPAPTVQSAEQIQNRLDERITASRRAADALYTHWIEALG
ncbi:MAG: type 1 glutamine amidotransferase [Gammaproteobacteria bacterium]